MPVKSPFQSNVLRSNLLRLAGLSACLAVTFVSPLSAQTFTDYEIYSPDPAVSADVVGTPYVDAAGDRVFVLRDPFTGHHDHHRLSSNGQWLTIGTDSLVNGGLIVSPKAGDPPPSTQCVGPLVLVCAGIVVGAAGAGARAAICEMRTSARVRRARQACEAAGHGLEITQQSRCENVMTRCIITRPRVQLQ